MKQEHFNGQIGRPASRVEGPAKVTGKAQYAAEFFTDGLTYGYVVSSAIAKGRIRSIDAAAARALEGVLEVLTHENVTGLPWLNYKYTDEDTPPGKPFRPLYDDTIRFNCQPIALVVAETFELARYAASLIEVDYEQAEHSADLLAGRSGAKPPKKYRQGPPPKPRGDAKKAFGAADVKLKPEYYHAPEHHNPMEMHASTAIWEDDGTLTVYDKTQGVQASQKYISKIFGFSKKDVRVRSHYMGGGFGSGLRPQYQLFLTVLAAKYLKRSVRLVLTRQQMFSFGHRPETGQLLGLGASKDGQLQALYHYVFSETSRFEEYTETVADWGGVLYNAPNAKFGHNVVYLDRYTPLDMRAPGAATGLPALESAMDELAYELKMDPLELRLKNYTDRDLNKDLPFSSKALRECYQQAAAAFGWKDRPAEPRSMREGHKLIGWGMATGVWEAQQMPAAAKAVYTIDGRLTVSSATSDIGTGTSTIMTQIAADTLGLPLDSVTFKLGDSSLPFSLLEGGSWTAASTGTAVKEVCLQVAEKILSLAGKLKKNPLEGRKLKDLRFDNGRIRTKDGQEVLIADILRAAGVFSIEEKKLALPNLLKQRKYARNTHSAVFAEVEVDEDLGIVHVRRMVTAVAAGAILNPKTARSQVLGGMVWGIGMALHEGSLLDHHYGRFMNHNFSEYHIPCNADVAGLEVIFVEENDKIVNPLGVKGLGEIGIVGVPAAISNAVFHATGKRVREWPLTLDKLL